MEKLRIIVGGYIGLYPTGGATWDYIQYPLGLKMMGHDVYYIEDTLQYPVFQNEGDVWDDATGTVSYLKEVMRRFGMDDRWAYRDIASGQSFGMSEHRILELCRTADLFINISCSTHLRDEYFRIPKRVLIDSDPMFTQVQYALEMLAGEETRDWTTRQMMENHTHLFTFGENIGALDCAIPQFGFRWLKTRQPICLDYWDNQIEGKENAFTSIMNWSGRKKLMFENEEWGQKDVEFEKFKTVPGAVPSVAFELAVNKPQNKDSHFSASELERLGWRILDPQATVATVADYKQFILGSAAEFGVAKETYVKSNSGWFSCRSACYLAAGRPVITQETQWSKFIPTGEGLFSFTDIDSAVEAINKVQSDLSFHSRRAREIAREYFDSNIVLARMLEQLNQD